MSSKGFEDLRVWQTAHRLVLDIYRITKFFPVEERFGLTSQIRRSSVSICANIAEGYLKSRKDFMRYLDIGRGSLEETKYHLILSRDLNYCSTTQFQDLFKICDDVGKMLYGLKTKFTHPDIGQRNTDH